MTTQWNIYLDGKKIDSVFYQDGMEAWEVKDGLINHDGYDERIKVVKARGKKSLNYLNKIRRLTK